MFAVRYKKIFLILTSIILLASAAVIATLNIPLGIDFTGGSLTEVGYDVRPEKSAMTEDLNSLNLGDFSLRETVDDVGRDGYILRSRDLSEQERITVSETFLSRGEAGDITRFTSVGPVIGEELKDKALWAIGIVSLVIILYVAFAFRGVSYPVGSWVYGGITIIALLHDVLIPTAVISLLGYFFGVEADVLFIMALLAVLGYSVNDTIVVFDRVRENIMQYRKEKKTQTKVGGVSHESVSYVLTKPFGEIVGLSVSQTIMRSINTSLTTLLSLIALYFFGGEVTETFALVLIVGVVAGTYSSICLANPLLVFFAEKFAPDVSK